jgi:hypothetical protein
LLATGSEFRVSRSGRLREDVLAGVGHKETVATAPLNLPESGHTFF